MVICREHARCHARQTCIHAKPHRDMGQACWPDSDKCPGCTDGKEEPPEWRQRTARRLGLRETKDYAAMRNYDRTGKIAIV